jgi:hypothetical protein
MRKITLALAALVTVAIAAPAMAQDRDDHHGTKKVIIKRGGEHHGMEMRRMHRMHGMDMHRMHGGTKKVVIKKDY